MILFDFIIDQQNEHVRTCKKARQNYVRLQLVAGEEWNGPSLLPPLLCEITFVQRVYCVLFHNELKMGKKLCLFSVKLISRKNNLNVDFLVFFGQNSAFVQKLHFFPSFKSSLCMLTNWCKAKACFVSFCRGKMWKMRKFFEEYWLLHKYATSTVKMLCSRY